MTALRLLAYVSVLLFASQRAVLGGEFKPYKQAEFEKVAAEKKPILLDFEASWCSICAAQMSVIRQLTAQERYRDLAIFAIDFDSAKELLNNYKVDIQSTLIVLTGKQEQGRSVGDTSRDGIERLLNRVVAQDH